ncbi:MAG: FAD-binding oxidoreductase [Chloroflexi bacterium]|nr:FAD-binding oxidoreductase [Chloroflexota bacterium]
MPEKMYDYIVVGRGMIGSAAARHLSASVEGVALIGPDEPEERANHQGVFGSHYDEGRITRILDTNQIWALLAQRSIERYAKIEESSGVKFYSEVGHLTIGPESGDSEDYISKVQAVGDELGVDYKRLSPSELAAKFPYLNCGAESVGLYQPTKGGHVSPRSLVRAQTVAAERQGATVIRQFAHSVSLSAGYVEVTTDNGEVYRAAKVLVATGGYANTANLLPRKLGISIDGISITLAQVGLDEAERLRDMPSVIYRTRNADGGCYLLPPIVYPDGKCYLKIGGGPFDESFRQQLDSSSSDDIRKWFQSSGTDRSRTDQCGKLTSIIPALQQQSIHTESCMVTRTPSGLPFIDMTVEGKIGVAVGGNGSAAKSSDEIGYVAAQMMLHDGWNYDIPAKHFTAQYE